MYLYRVISNSNRGNAESSKRFIQDLQVEVYFIITTLTGEIELIEFVHDWLSRYVCVPIEFTTGLNLNEILKRF